MYSQLARGCWQSLGETDHKDAKPKNSLKFLRLLVFCHGFQVWMIAIKTFSHHSLTHFPQNKQKSHQKQSKTFCFSTKHWIRFTFSYNFSLKDTFVAFSDLGYLHDSWDYKSTVLCLFCNALKVIRNIFLKKKHCQK